MNQQNIKLYYILPAIVLVIMVTVVLLLPKKSTPTQTTPTPTVQTPTLLPSYNYPPPTVAPSGSKGKNITPTLIPAAYTGAVDDQQIPQAEADLATQKNDLRRKLPFTQAAFTITFDYANDQFTVSLNEPKDASKTQFNQWVQANYPAIPADRFSFK